MSKRIVRIWELEDGRQGRMGYHIEGGTGLHYNVNHLHHEDSQNIVTHGILNKLFH